MRRLRRGRERSSTVATTMTHESRTRSEAVDPLFAEFTFIPRIREGDVPKFNVLFPPILSYPSSPSVSSRRSIKSQHQVPSLRIYGPKKIKSIRTTVASNSANNCDHIFSDARPLKVESYMQTRKRTEIKLISQCHIFVPTKAGLYNPPFLKVKAR